MPDRSPPIMMTGISTGDGWVGITSGYSNRVRMQVASVA
jgi:hypothetical protein